MKKLLLSKTQIRVIIKKLGFDYIGVKALSKKNHVRVWFNISTGDLKNTTLSAIVQNKTKAQLINNINDIVARHKAQHHKVLGLDLKCGPEKKEV